MRPVLIAVSCVAVALGPVGGPVGDAAVLVGALSIAWLATRHQRVGLAPTIAAVLYVLAASDVASVLVPPIAEPVRLLAIPLLVVIGFRAVTLLGPSVVRNVLRDATFAAVVVVGMLLRPDGTADQVVQLALVAVTVFVAAIWAQFVALRQEARVESVMFTVAMALMLFRVGMDFAAPAEAVELAAALGMAARLILAVAIARPAIATLLAPRPAGGHRLTASRALVTTGLLVVVAAISRVSEIVDRDALAPWQLLLPVIVLVSAAARVRGLHVAATDDNRELRRVSRLDATSGALNEEGLVASLAADDRRDDVLFAVEIDGLRSMLRRLDTATGADIARTIAGRLAALGGRGALVARCDTDEFVLVLAGASERLVADVEATLGDALLLSASSVSVQVSVRIGWAAVDPVDPVSALACARFAADEAAPGQAVEFAEEQRDRYREQRLLMYEFPAALRNGDVRPHYQAILSTETGRIVAFELLARWTHPERGAISPVDFIPIAESSGAIVHLGERLLGEGCEQLAAWRRLPGHEELQIAVNLSPRQLADPDLHARVTAALARAGLPPDALTLELTEGMLADLDDGGHRLADIRSSGVKLAVDDFGTGYSSLSYLDQLRPDVVKVDRRFTARITAPDGDVARGIFELLDQLGVPVVAEGVEDQDTFASLRPLGCERWQGFLHSRPVAAEDATALLLADEADQPTRAQPLPVASSVSAVPVRGTLEPLLQPAIVVDDHRPWRDVQRLFLDDRRLGTVVVKRGDGALVPVTAGDVHRLMIGPYGYGRSLYADKPIRGQLDAPVRAIDADTSIVDAIAIAMARPDERRYDELLVDDRGRIGLVAVSALLAALADDLGQLAVRDDLTGLPNRRHFIGTLERWSAERVPLGVLFVDLDGFKPINDLHGHAAGDAVLLAAATRFRACARPRDVVARLGGDEFALGLRDVSPATVAVVAERLVSVLRPMVPWREHELRVTASVGRAHGLWDGPDELIGAADLSMYDAKRDPVRAIGPLAIGTAGRTSPAAAPPVPSAPREPLPSPAS